MRNTECGVKKDNPSRREGVETLPYDTREAFGKDVKPPKVKKIKSSKCEVRSYNNFALCIMHFAFMNGVNSYGV